MTTATGTFPWQDHETISKQTGPADTYRVRWPKSMDSHLRGNDGLGNAPGFEIVSRLPGKDDRVITLCAQGICVFQQAVLPL